MHELVGEFQNAFMQGRLMYDTCLISSWDYPIEHTLKKKEFSLRCIENWHKQKLS